MLPLLVFLNHATKLEIMTKKLSKLKPIDIKNIDLLIKFLLEK